MKHYFLRQTADLLLKREDQDNIEDSISQFMENLSRIGRGEMKIEREELNSFLKDTAPLVNDASLPLHQYLFRTENILTNEFYGDEWNKVCSRRSNIEFLREMYHDYFDPDWNLFLDCENLDDMLRQKGDYEGGLSESQIPAGTPSSHWWWWYPEKPAIT